MSVLSHSSYGALELKRTYQKNMLLGSLSALTLTAIIFTGIWIFLALQPPPPDPPIIDDDRGGHIIIDSIHFVKRRPDIPIISGPVGPRIKPHSVIAGGRPVPVVMPLDTIASLPMPGEGWNNFSHSPIPAGTSPGNGGGGGIGGIEYIPPSDTFISVEELPVLIKEIKPEYPRLAREGGFSGFVIIEAYIDKTGKVHQAQVAKCSRHGMGFEEMALAAAYKSVYRPAIQNHIPVGVWISYKVQFTLE